MDNYAIEILEKEIHVIETCLSEWELNQYDDARKQREKRLRQLKTSVVLLRHLINSKINSDLV